MNLELSNHATKRLAQRVGVSPDNFFDLFKSGQYIDIYERGGCQHCLFYSEYAENFYTAIIDYKIRKVITITPISKWVTGAMKRAAKACCTRPKVSAKAPKPAVVIKKPTRKAEIKLKVVNSWGEYTRVVQVGRYHCDSLSDALGIERVALDIAKRVGRLGDDEYFGQLVISRKNDGIIMYSTDDLWSLGFLVRKTG